MKPLKKMYLLPQDKLFLKYVHSVKVATYKQIQRDCYPKIKVDTVSKRLRNLELNKFLRIEISRSLLGKTCLASISKIGFEEFIKNDSTLRKELMSDAIEHDLYLVDIRYVFLNIPATLKYLTENEIQTWGHKDRELNSDAIVTFSLKERTFTIPIEYELHMKEEKRYESLVRKYYSSKEHPFVFFVTENESILRKISKVEEKLFDWEKPKFFYQTRTNFIEHGNLFFINRKGKTLNLTLN